MNSKKRPAQGRHGFHNLTDEDDLLELFRHGRSDGQRRRRFSDTIAELSADTVALAASEKTEDRDTGGRKKRVPSIPPHREIDLHGLTGPEAMVKVNSFILTSLGQKKGCVRIITGKGLHSEGPAVLRDIVEEQLDELKKKGVVARWAWEKKKKEKSGSVLVYLP